MKIKSEKDFSSGLLFVGFGVAFAWGSFSYQVGVASLTVTIVSPMAS